MTLTTLQKALVRECARLMGLNGGLAYIGLTADATIRDLTGCNSSERENNRAVMQRIKSNFGLPQACVAEIVYAAIHRGDARMRISVSPPVKPRLDRLELSVLRSAALILVPRGGFFTGYRTILQNNTRIDPVQLNNVIHSLNYKFNTPNLERAIVSAFASGILHPYSLFGPQLPAPLRLILNSDSFLEASQYHVTGVYDRVLSADETAVARELVKKMGQNGGLFWGRKGWLSESALAAGDKTGYSPMKTMRSKFGISHTGLLMYQVSEQLEEKVKVNIPSIRCTDFDEVELKVMLASARTLLPTGGFYSGHIRTVSQTLFYHPHSVSRVNQRVVEKTGTANLGQAVTYFIAHGLTPVSSLRLDVRRTPALEAIVNAMPK